MVRFDNEPAKGPAPKPTDYVYEQTYTSFWDAVLQQERGTTSETSFEKPGTSSAGTGTTAVSMNGSASASDTAKAPSAVACAVTKSDSDDYSEHKEEEHDAVVALKSPPPTEASISTLERTQALLEAHAVAEAQEQEASADEVGEEVATDEEQPDEEVVVVTTTTKDNTTSSPTMSPTNTCSEESVEDSAEHIGDIQLAPESSDETNNATKTEEVASPTGSGTGTPPEVSQMMAKMVTEAAKKELEARLQQQKAEEEAEQLNTTAVTADTTMSANTTMTAEDNDFDLEEPPMDAEALAKAHAKLLEQAKSLAKAQALLEAQAKALARQQQMQQANTNNRTPPKTPTGGQSPKGSAAHSPSKGASPSLVRPAYLRAPSDEAGAAHITPPSSTSHIIESEARSAPISVATTPNKTERLTAASMTNSPSLVRYTPKSPLSPGDTDEIQACLDGDWLKRAKSEAKAKAQAIIQAAQVEASTRTKEAQALIQAAQAEAAARAQARADTKAKALAEERARQKAEIETQLKENAVRDAWEFEEMRACIKLEERRKIKLKADAKAEAEAKLRAKAEADAALVIQQQEARVQAQIDLSKLRSLAKESAEAKLRRKAEEDAALLQKQQDVLLKAQEQARLERRAQEEAWLRKQAEEEGRPVDETDATANKPAPVQGSPTVDVAEVNRLRSLAKEHAEAKLRRKAEEDAANFERLQEEARLKKMQEEARAKQRNAKAQQDPNWDVNRLRTLAKEKAEEKMRRKAEEDEALFEERQEQARLQVKAKEEARLHAVAEAEHKLRLKAEADAKKWREAEARAQAERDAIARANAEARVRARESQQWQPHLSAAQIQARAIVRGDAAPSTQIPPPTNVPKDFVPFGKSKGEEADGDISLFLQVPGVVHVSELKVELEDGVLYISRGIVLKGRGLQKFTRSFPFEEDLLDTSRITGTLIPANATADGVSVLRFTLPKAASSWRVPLCLADEPDYNQENQEMDSSSRHSTSNKGGDMKADLKDLTDVSLDAPDDESSYHRSDAPKDEQTIVPEVPEEEEPAEELQKTYNKDGFRVVELMQLPLNFALENIVVAYSEDGVCVVGSEGKATVFRHVVTLGSPDMDVRQLQGWYDPWCGTLILKAPLFGSLMAPKNRRIRVVKHEDSSDLISLFGDDNSVCSYQQSGTGKPPSSSSLTSQAKKHGLKLTGGLKSVASKYLRLKSKSKSGES